MYSMKKPNQNAWLWWLAVISLSIGISIFVLLDPAPSDLKLRQIRTTALVGSLLITGLCLIIGTRKYWFGKGL